MKTIDSTNAASSINAQTAQEAPVTQTTARTRRSKEEIAADQARIAELRAAAEAKRVEKGYKKPGPKVRAATAPKLPKRDAASLTLSPEVADQTPVSRKSKRDEQLEDLSEFVKGLGTPDEAIAIMNEVYAINFAQALHSRLRLAYAVLDSENSDKRKQNKNV